MTRVPAILMAGIMMTACTTVQREEAAAPVVKVTPRESVVAPPAAPVAPVPQKQQTRVFAYRDPALEPDPIAAPIPGTPAAPDGSAPASIPGAPDLAQGAPAPTPSVPTQPPAAGSPPEQIAVAPPASSAVPSLPPAADALARQAEQQRQAGDYAGAAASLERSLRIAPRESYLWNRLARVRLEQGQSAQAGNLAARSNDLAGNTPTIKQDNWRIIAEARRRSGDVTGASEAEQRASGN
jgi:tetratricopeptide (TPR) repeat protein